ncbi:hypothetical protein [Exiguobacterium mexicanum]|uniref:hypothetical protein n=1 Tax=Exiguobacterium mexicanum TaxID=340146 RepID=UPI0037BEF664
MNTKQRIELAARRRFALEGYEGLSLAALAEDVGIKKRHCTRISTERSNCSSTSSRIWRIVMMASGEKRGTRLQMRHRSNGLRPSSRR